MRLHSLQHVPFEGLAHIESWAWRRGHDVSRILLFQGEVPPPVDELDLLVVMGGPMGASDEKLYPWLAGEKRYIEEAVAGGKAVLGVCLGAQLIASVLGARVYANEQKEIGWFPVRLTEEGKASSLFGALPREFTPFHWHGDTFDIPEGAVRTSESDACPNQAFEYEGRIVGLQFHLESTPESVAALVENCRDEIVEGPYVQSEAEILSLRESSGGLNAIMDPLMDGLAGNAERPPE